MEGVLRIRTILSASVLLAASEATAALTAEVEFLGFSEDGTHAAMLEHWFNDGSGAPSARLIVASTQTGDPVWSEELVWPESLVVVAEGPVPFLAEDLNPAGDSLLVRASGLLDSLGIGWGRPVVHCLSHPMTDRGVDPDRAVFVQWVMSPTHMTREMTLELIENQCELENPPVWLSMFDPPVLLTVTVTGADGEALFCASDMDRQQNIDVYARQRFVSDYRIRDIYLMGLSIAVVLDAVEPGFEGPDGMHRLVTGTLCD
jgi:predicted secreted protein